MEDNWLDASPADMEKIRDLIQEDLVRPADNSADLMYKLVDILDSRHSLQLNTRHVAFILDHILFSSF